MMGKLGFDIVVSELGEKDLAYCRQAIGEYNSFRHLVGRE